MTYSENDIHESIDTINNHIGSKKVSKAIILGTGLGKLLDQFEIKGSMPYSQIPHFPVSTVPSHLGKLILAEYEGELVWVLAGRLHYYEGYSMDEITFPILVLKYLGVENIMITNASGALNPELSISDIVLVNDHINLMPENPLRGHSRFGSRFIDLSNSYDTEFLDISKRVASRENIQLKNGVYVCVMGPTYETKAEAKYYRQIGGDVIGMSSIPEVIMARQQNMKVALFSVVTNEHHDQNQENLSLDLIVRRVEQAIPQLGILIKNLLQHKDSPALK